MFILFTIFTFLSHIKINPSPPPVKKPLSPSLIYRQFKPFLCAFLVLVKLVPEHINKFPLILPHINNSFKYPQHIIEVRSEPFNPVHFFFFIFPFDTSNI